MDPEKLEASIRSFLRDDLRVAIDAVPRDEDLVTTGLIDSTDLVRLATHLERMLGITIPDQDIRVENFDSIVKILDYVATRIGS